MLEEIEMYKIAICDDSSADTLYLQNLVSMWAKNIEEKVEIQTFLSAEAFWFQYRII